MKHKINMKKMQKLHNFWIWKFFTKSPHLAENFSTPRRQKQPKNKTFFCFLIISTKKRRSFGLNLWINYGNEKSAYLLHIYPLELKVGIAPNTKTNKMWRFYGDFVWILWRWNWKTQNLYKRFIHRNGAIKAKKIKIQKMKNMVVSFKNTYYAAVETPALKNEENMNRKNLLFPLALCCIVLIVRRIKERRKENDFWLRRRRYPT